MSLSVPTHDNTGKHMSPGASQSEAIQSNKCILDWSACVEDDQSTSEMSHLQEDQPTAKMSRLHEDKSTSEMSHLHDDLLNEETSHLHEDKSTSEMSHLHDDLLNEEMSRLHVSPLNKSPSQFPLYNPQDDRPIQEMHHLHVSPLNKSPNQFPLCNSQDDRPIQEMHRLHVSPLNKSPNQFPLYNLHNNQSQIPPLNKSSDHFPPCNSPNFPIDLLIPWQARPNQFATIAIDGNYLAVVSNTIFLEYELRSNWCHKILYTLECAGITELFCCGYYVELKRAAGDFMNVYLDAPEMHMLRYPCNMCKAEDCVVQKAFLFWRKISRRRPCNLEHYVKG